ncbi:MAG: hypothetical protein K1X72_12055 [Pyrinomonadaceae bacterium]|nr:hypothetical protein [Pyrinomonadaceae bacterium]
MDVGHRTLDKDSLTNKRFRRLPRHLATGAMFRRSSAQINYASRACSLLCESMS